MRPWWAWIITAACGGGHVAPETPPEATKLRVVTTTLPARWMVEQLAGDLAEVSTIRPPGGDHASWQPSQDDIVTMQMADLIVVNGAGYEPWLDDVVLPRERVLDTSQALVQPIPQDAEGVPRTPFLWASPRRAANLAFGIHGGLLHLMPDHQDALDTELNDLARLLETTEFDYANAIRTPDPVSVAVTSPHYGYLLYDMHIDALTVHPTEAGLPAEERAAVERWMTSTPAPHQMWWPAEPTPQQRAGLPEGIDHLQVHLLDAPIDGTYDYIGQVKHNASVIRRARSDAP